MKIWKWERGRQAAGYEKLLLWSFWRLDSYIIRYPAGCFLPPHTDKNVGRHYRLNIILKGVGEFSCEKTIIRTKRFVLFRPDLYEHSMQNGDSKRLVLSFGVLI